MFTFAKGEMSREGKKTAKKVRSECAMFIARQ